jgi:hypothetical protein
VPTCMTTNQSCVWEREEGLEKHPPMNSDASGLHKTEKKEDFARGRQTVVVLGSWCAAILFNIRHLALNETRLFVKGQRLL